MCSCSESKGRGDHFRSRGQVEAEKGALQGCCTIAKELGHRYFETMSEGMLKPVVKRAFVCHDL
jgi:hypothetical protein